MSDLSDTFQRAVRSSSGGGRTSGQAPTFEDVPLTPADEDDRPAYLGGVPDDYYVNRRTTEDYGYERRVPGTTGLTYEPQTVNRDQRVTPQFQEGDEYRYYGASPQEIARLQAALTAAGLLDPDDYAPGFIGGADNDPTIGAIRTIMGFANRAGFTTVEDALRAYVTSGYGEVGARDYEAARGAAARLPAPVSNADDLRRVFRSAVIETLGTGWSEQQIEGLVANYQAAERGFNAQVAAGESLPEMQLPTPETFAIEQARTADPTGAQTQEFLGAADQFNQIIGRWSGR